MKKYYNFLIVPQGQEPAINFRLSTFVVRALVSILILWLIALLIATVFYGKLSYIAVNSSRLEQENEKLRDYNSKVVEIEKSFKKNLELVAKIASLAGVELYDIDASLLSFEDSLQLDSTGRAILAGLAGDGVPPLSVEELEKLRVPQGRPLYGWITRGFVDEEGKEKHKGVDIAVKEGTPIAVSATGVVEFIGWDKDFGKLIIVDHENGYKTVYGHNQNIIAREGEKVYKGDIIALSGNSGRSSAPHLHYEIVKDGVAIDPSQYLD